MSAATSSPSLSKHSKSYLRVSLLLLGGLLFLRFPFLTGIAWFDKEGKLLDWVYSVFFLGTYLLTAILIWWERDRLTEFHIDILSGIIFAFQTFCFIIGIGLFAKMRRDRARFPSPPSGVSHWLLLGAYSDIIVTVVAQLLDLNPTHPRTPAPAAFGFLFSHALVQMTNAAVFEEPLFRGFLWGYLRLAGWKDFWIWLFQAALFTLGHIFYLHTEPVLTWFVRMLMPSLVFGLVVWGARSIAASMVAHGFSNATLDMILHTRSSAEAMNTAIHTLIGIAIVFMGSAVIRKRLVKGDEARLVE